MHFPNASSASTEIITVFTLQLVNVVYHTYSLAYVKPALLVRDAKPLGHDER